MVLHRMRSFKSRPSYATPNPTPYPSHRASASASLRRFNATSTTTPIPIANRAESNALRTQGPSYSVIVLLSTMVYATSPPRPQVAILSPKGAHQCTASSLLPTFSDGVVVAEGGLELSSEREPSFGVELFVRPAVTAMR